VLQYITYLHYCVAIHYIHALCVEYKWICVFSPNQHNLTLPPPYLLLPSDQALVFGCPLDKLCAQEKTTFPKFIAQCIREVEARGLNSQGIYRLSGNAAEITRLRYLVDQGEVSRRYVRMLGNTV